MKTDDQHLRIDISYAMSICLRNGIKVYPVVSGRMFKVEVDDNGSKIVYPKEVSSKEINNALSKTYKHFAIILLKEKEDANQTKKSKPTMETRKQTIYKPR